MPVHSFDINLPLVFVLLVALSGCSHPVNADAGSVFAWIIGGAIGLLCVCAAIGYYARRNGSS